MDWHLILIIAVAPFSVAFSWALLVIFSPPDPHKFIDERTQLKEFQEEFEKEIKRNEQSE